MNFELLQQNIRELISNKDLTQAKLVESAGMTQANVSKPLNQNEAKQFTLDQLYHIAQHFGISIDELVGNNAESDAAMSPRTVLAFLTPFLCEARVKNAKVIIEEVYFLIIDLYRRHSIEEEPFKMVLKGYLYKLPER